MKKLIIAFGMVILSVCPVFASTDGWKYIGMPVGGICTGQVYLGGDGQLWYWDIFNIAAIDPGGAGDRYYLNPLQQQEKFTNGFGIVVREGAKEYARTLNAGGFADISFEGEYPIGKVTYKDSQLPVVVRLNAFSPFIPTDAENSGLPVIRMEYEVKNVSDKKLWVELDGWLQNMSCFQTGCGSKGRHHNEVIAGEGYNGVFFSSDTSLSHTHADWGSMALTLLDKEGIASADCREVRGTCFWRTDPLKKEADAVLGCKLVGGVKKEVELKGGESHTFVFLISWNFPNIHLWDGGHAWRHREDLRYYYSKYFGDSKEVVDYVVKHPWLVELTKRWNKTWYASSLPKEFLNRTFANVSTLATTASVRFHDLKNDPYNEGRYYNFEGVYLGEGTCRHVSHYGQVLGRIFPDLARKHREQIDLGLSLTPEGVIGYRGEFSHSGQHDGRGYAVDGQAGTILGVYREYLMSSDDVFLKSNWTKVKKAMQYMIRHDKEKGGKADGILEGTQYNTLDRMWYGKIPWLSGLYIAALRASSKMAEAVGDRFFAKECMAIALRGEKNISDTLYNGEYFIQELDPEHPEAPNVNAGCHIDQLLGQYWASQLGLGHIFPQEQIHSALKAIMKYNFVQNYSDYLACADIPVARWFADGDEQGVVMCSFPKGGSDKAAGVVKSDWEKLVVGYFSEIFTGQEHALAATLLDENMVEEAMKVETAIWNRYDVSKRNPYNEVEYGNHYTRAMSGYAPFISASGFYYNGPEGVIGFDPKIGADDFKSAFIAAEGWGSYSQKRTFADETYTLELKYGKLRLKRMILHTKLRKPVIHAKINGKPIIAKISCKSGIYCVNFDKMNLKEGESLVVCLKE